MPRGTTVTAVTPMAWAMLGGGAGMGDMTLQLLALAMVLVLALPAVVLLLRRGAASDEGEPATVLDTVWLIVPVVLLAVLVAFAVAA